MSVHSFRWFEGLGRDWLQPKPPSRRRGHLIVTKHSFRMKLQKLRSVTLNAVSCIYSYIRKRGVYSTRRKGSAIYFELMSNCLLAHRELFSLASGRQRDQGLSGESRGRLLYGVTEGLALSCDIFVLSHSPSHVACVLMGKTVICGSCSDDLGPLCTCLDLRGQSQP